MKILRILLPLLTFTLGSLPHAAHAASPIRTPAAGTPERKSIMDALRVPVQADLHQSVIFKVTDLRVTDQWAFLNGEPMRADGSKVDYRKTRYQEQIDMGFFDRGISALLKKTQGQWQVVKYSIGHTDVIYDGWDREYGVPRSVLGLR